MPKVSDSFGNKQEGAAESLGGRDGESPREDYERRVAEVMSRQEAAYDQALAERDKAKEDFDSAMYEWHRKELKKPKTATREEIEDAVRALPQAEQQSMESAWYRSKDFEDALARRKEAVRYVNANKPEPEKNVRLKISSEEFPDHDFYGEDYPAQKMEGAPRRATEAQRRVAKAVTDVMRKAGITVKGRKEMAEVLERMMDEETKTDMEMMSAAKRNPSAKPARDANVSPTVGGGINPRAKVAISDENRKDLTENIDRLHSSVSQGVTAQEFLRLLKKAFGFSDERTRNADISEYVTNAIADDSHTLRLANHHVTASTYKKHNAQANNTAIVIKMSDKRFRGDGSVSLVEFVYFPDRLTPERMHGVIDGLKDWVERGEYTHTDYDDRKVSGRDNLLQSTTEGNGERTEFLKTRDGEVYGFVKDGEVYIDETVMDPEVPLHEYTHLWDRAVRKSNPELWRRGKELMRELPLWDEVVNDPAYADIAHDEDLVASEVHSRLTGKDGARKLDEMVAEAERQGDVIAQAKAITLRERVRQWLKDLYGWVRGAFGGKWDKKAVASVTLEEWNAMPLKDLAEGVNGRVGLNVASAKDPESRAYMILGEKGAKALDNRDEATTRMDNLDVARKMEREDKDARAIRIVTGWERGADGKWRYEVPDEIEAIKGAVSKFEEYRTMWSERNRMRNEGLTLPSVSLTELDRMVMADSGYGLPLASLMDEDNALFKAYPRLQYINLNVVDEPLSTQAGSYGGGVITLNKGNLADIPVESAFIHEIQHAIQHIEGFAEGGNVKTARDYIKKHRDRAVEAIERTLQEHIDAAKPAWDEVKRINSLEWNDENWSEREAELAQAESEAKRQDETVERWRKFLDTAKRKAWSEISDEEAQEVYRNIAGEVEARNASTRMNFSEDERREKLLEDTEDVAREDQIFLHDNLGESASDGLRYRDDKLYLLGDPAETFEDRRKAAVENRGTVTPGLADAEVKIVDVPMHGYTGSIAEATKQAKAAAKEKFAPNGQPRILTYDNFGTSFEYSISGGAIDESLNPKLAKSVANKGVQLAVVEHLDGVIGESIEVEEHADYISKDAQGKRTTDKASKTAIMHRFYGAVECDGVKYRVMTLMRENAAKADANGVHAYEVQKIEVLDAETSSTSNGAGTVEPSVEGQYPVAKLLNGVDKSYDPGKKILDESAKADRETSDVDVRQRAVDKATETAKGLNTQVRVVKAADIKGANDAETARMRRAKGWYDVRTGEITIVEDNISSVDDAVTTVLHETVAHKGLRMLEAGNFPFADSLIQSIRARKKEQEEMQAQQMQMPQGWMLQ